MNKQLRLAGLVLVLGLVLGFGYWQRQGSAAGYAGNRLEQIGNGLSLRFSPTSTGKASRPTLRLASAKAMATVSVTSLEDGPATAANCPGTSCRLRDAIAAAASGDTINFSVAGTITLNSGELYIGKDLTIQGPGAAQLTISGNVASRVFNIGGGFTVALSGLTATKGYISGNHGGNIYNSGVLTMTNCTISDGYTTMQGGGFMNFGSLTISNSTISGNSCGEDGGGIFNVGSLTIANTTMSGNISTYTGGGIRTGGGDVTLVNCTISGNQGSFAGGVSSPGPGYPVYFRNTIISGNIETANFGLPEVTGWETNLGNSLVGGTPLLTSLGNYGGATQTYALLPGSPAINAGDDCVLTNTCASNNLGFNLTTDQRGGGFTRKVGGAVDIGAFESRGFTLVVSGGNNQSTKTNTDFATPLAVTVSANGSGEPIGGGQVTFTPPASGAGATVAGTPATVDSGGTATSGIVTANATAGSYNVQAGGAGFSAVSFSLTNLPVCSTITVSPAAGSLPAGAVGTSYAQQFTQSGGAGAISWSVAPAIPGLSIDSTGLLSGVPTTAGSYPFTVQATDANGCSGSTSYTLVIAKTNQTITFGPLASKTYGDAAFTVSATASSSLPVSFSALGNCTVSGNTVTITGAGSCTITASQAGNNNYNAAPSVQQGFSIAKASATLTLSNLNQTYNGSPRSVTVTTNPVGLTGVSVTYNGSTTAPTNAGSYAVVASLNNANYQASNATGTLVIAKGNQTITFGPLANKAYGDAPFTVSATASSGLAVSFAATGDCAISGNTVTITRVGSCTITASQAGNANYNAAASVSQSFTIAKGNQTITFAPLANKTYGDPDFSVSATASSGLAVSFSAAGNCTVTNSTVRLTGAGACTISASQAGNSNYNAAPSVSQSFSIAKAAATLTLGALNQAYNGSPKSVTVTTSPANLTGVSVTYDGAATAPTNAGSYAVAASLNNANYQAANATGTLVITKASQTITFGNLANKAFGDAPFTVSATASSGLPVSFSATGSCTVSGATVTLTGAGSCSITASQAGNTNYSAATPVTQSFTIAKANQTITFGPLANKTYGDVPFTIGAAASSSLPVSFSATGNCTISGSTVTITGAGSCTIAASQAGDANYNAAPSVSQSFTIAKAAATLTLSVLNQVYDGSPKSVTVTTSPAGLTGVSVTYGNSATAPTNAGNYAVVASLSNANYQAANATGTLVISKIGQTITFGSLANKAYGDPDYAVSASASSGLAVSFSAAGNCKVSGSTVTITGVGACTITASQPGDTNYNAATPVAQSFSIAKAAATLTLSNLNQVYDGSPKSVTVTTSPANLTGVSVTYDGSATAPTNAGSYAVAASLNNASYQASNATGTLVIAQASQTISFNNLANRTFGDAPFTVGAKASSGLPVSFSAGGNCTVSGSTVTLTGAGSCKITASQAGNANYRAATPVTQSFTIAKANQAIAFGALPDKAYGDAPFTVNATASSGLPVGFTATGNCTVSGNTVTLAFPGSCTITASQAGDANYNAAPSVSQSFNIVQNCQALALSTNTLPQGTVGVAYSTTINTRKTGVGPFQFTVSGLPNGLAAQTVPGGFSVAISGTPLQAGTFTVQVNVVDSTGCTNGGNNLVSLTIAKANQAITFGPLTTKIFGDSPFTVSATASSGLPVSFSASGNCTVAGSTVTLTGVGSCTITAAQAGDANYNAAPSVSQTFRILANCPTITLSPATLPQGAVGAPYSATITPDKLGNPPFQFTVSGLPGGLQVQATTLDVTISGIPQQAGVFNVQVNVVDSAGCTASNLYPLTIDKGTPTIFWPNPASISCGTALGSTQLNAIASGGGQKSLRGTYVYTPPAGTVLGIGSHSLTVNFTPTDTANWNPATASVVLAVTPKPYITLNAYGRLTKNDHQYYTFTVDQMVASVTDGCATLDKSSVVITSVTSDEPDDLIGVPSDGNTIDDIKIASDCKSVQLRDERDTTLDGRVYKVMLRVNATGATAVFYVTAPLYGTATEGAVYNKAISKCGP